MDIYIYIVCLCVQLYVYTHTILEPIITTKIIYPLFNGENITKNHHPSERSEKRPEFGSTLSVSMVTGIIPTHPFLKFPSEKHLQMEQIN